MLNTALIYEPKNIEYLYPHAKICARLNYINDAINSFEKLCEIVPFYPKYWLSYAKFLNDKGLKSVAIEKLEESLSFVSNNPLILYRLAAYHWIFDQQYASISDEALTIDFDRQKFFTVFS
jgi:predicted Zn-dependent protease